MSFLKDEFMPLTRRAIWRLFQPRYRSVKEMLEMIDEPNRSAVKKLHWDNIDLFLKVQGSSHNHQAWPGGYYDHVSEVMNLAIVLYKLLNWLRPLPFSLSDLLLVVYLHDVEKPWKYEIGPDGKLQHKANLSSKAAHQEFRMAKLREYGIVLSPEQENGLKYAEGEHADYSNKRRAMGPLASAAHVCDNISARLFFDYPQKDSDPWRGAQRT